MQLPVDRPAARSSREGTRRTITGHGGTDLFVIEVGRRSGVGMLIVEVALPW